jgi:hypothetical protein
VTLLAFLARHGRWVLPSGMVLGVGFPALGQALMPMIAPLVTVLLFLAALRIGPEAARLRRAELAPALGLVLLAQLAAPLLAVGLFAAAGWLDRPLAQGVVLALAASPISGAAGIAILSRADPLPALRLMVLGTAVLPLTALPVFALLPVFGGAGDLVLAALRLLALVLLAGGGALALRAALPRLGGPRTAVVVDGLTSVGMGLLVIALMSGLGPALRAGDAGMLWVLAAALSLNFGMQLSVWALARSRGAGPRAPAYAIALGNRNMALFLGALPAETLAGVIVFVGLYQIPMFLTPLLLAPLYRRATGTSRPVPSRR